MATFTRAAPLKRLLLSFWAAWTAIVVTMNVFDLLHAAGLLPEDWALRSRNYDAILKELARLHPAPHALTFTLLLAATCWEALCSLLLLRALRRFQRPDRWRAIYLAFGALFALFAAFMLGDEFAHAYTMEGDHRGIMLLILASLLVLQLLPERA